jgi:hypothetical protein
MTHLNSLKTKAKKRSVKINAPHPKAWDNQYRLFPFIAVKINIYVFPIMVVNIPVEDKSYKWSKKILKSQFPQGKPVYGQ